MKSILVKWSLRGAIGLGSLCVLMLLLFGGIYWKSTQRMQRIFSVPGHTVAGTEDSTLLAYGRHVSQIRGCTDCHGGNLAGGVVIDHPLMGTLYASNLTSGRGGVGKHYTPQDWERAIRHGVAPSRKPLLMMPAQEYFYLSDQDLTALIAYLQALPPVDNELPSSTIGPVGRLLYLRGELVLVPAERIDHSRAHPSAPMRGVSAAYGEYLAIGCIGCHGQNFAGGRIPGAPPDWPPAADLTPSGNLKHWKEADFIRAARTGIKPDGTPFLPQMPYEVLKSMTDEELKAIWLFLQSLPPRTFEQTSKP